MREIALSREYRPPSQKGVKRVSVWNKGIEAPQLQGKRHGQWKGKEAGYVSIHKWVRRWKSVAKSCEKCGKQRTSVYSIQWANIDHKYRRVLDDYIALCIKCHHQFDRENNGYTR